jgi:hypothetical protein
MPPIPPGNCGFAAGIWGFGGRVGVRGGVGDAGAGGARRALGKGAKGNWELGKACAGHLGELGKGELGKCVGGCGRYLASTLFGEASFETVLPSVRDNGDPR